MEERRTGPTRRATIPALSSENVPNRPSIAVAKNPCGPGPMAAEPRRSPDPSAPRDHRCAAGRPVDNER